MAAFLSTLVLSSWSRASAALGRTSLHVVADNYVDSKYPERAYGTRPILYVGNSYDKSQDIWGHERIYVRFDLTRLPKGVFTVSAALRLYVYYAPKMSLPTALYKAAGKWAEVNQTWINQPPSEVETSRTVIGLEADVWVEWDATALVRAWINKSEENFGAMIKAVSEEKIRDHSAGAWSRECGISGLEPRLEVTYITGNEQLVIILTGTIVSVFVIVVAVTQARRRRWFRITAGQTRRIMESNPKARRLHCSKEIGMPANRSGLSFSLASSRQSTFVTV